MYLMKPTTNTAMPFLYRLQLSLHYTMLLAITCIVTPAYTQSPLPLYTIKGKILDNTANMALPLAQIVIVATRQIITANDKGEFTLVLPAGEHRVQCRYVGYQTITRVFRVEADIPMAIIRLQSLNYLLQEVSVFSRQNNALTEVDVAGTASLSSEAVQRTSGMMKEAFRAVQSMPGVTSNNEFSARFNVRGGNQDENLVLINGTQVFEPYHIKYAPQASIGVFNIDLIQKIDIMTGGFSAEYGDRMSSAVNMRYREGRKDKIGGSVGMSLANIDALVEGPLGEQASFIIGARQSFLQYLLKIVAPDEQISPSFYDVQGTLTYTPSPSHKLFFQFLRSGDVFRVGPTNETTRFPNVTGTVRPAGPSAAIPITGVQDNFNIEDVNSQYANTMLNLQHTYIMNAHTIWKNELALYDQRDDENGSRRDGNTLNLTATQNPAQRFWRDYERNRFANNQLTVNTLEVKSSLIAQITDTYELRGGISYQHLNFIQNRVDSTKYRNINTIDRAPDTTRTLWADNSSSAQFINIGSYKLAGYVENVLSFDNRLFVNLGGRFDYFDINLNATLSPRISATYMFESGTTLRAAWGHYYQSPLYQQLRLSQRADSNTKAQRAIHYVAGIEHRFNVEENAHCTFKIEGYYKAYSDLISSQRTFGNPIISNQGMVYSRRNDAIGHAMGFDIFTAFSAGRWSGWASYGYLVANEDNLSDAIGFYPRTTDQRHSASAILNFDAGKTWIVGFRYSFGSGFAYTPQVWNTQTLRWVNGARNGAYFPYYQRVDLRIDKGFVLFGLQASFFVDISNVLDRDNVYQFSYRYNSDGTGRIETIALFPLIPTAGLTVLF
jgi:hypothetical protein